MFTFRRWRTIMIEWSFCIGIDAAVALPLDRSFYLFLKW